MLMMAQCSAVQYDDDDDQITIFISPISTRSADPGQSPIKRRRRRRRREQHSIVYCAAAVSGRAAVKQMNTKHTTHYTLDCRCCLGRRLRLLRQTYWLQHTEQSDGDWLTDERKSLIHTRTYHQSSSTQHWRKRPTHTHTHRAQTEMDGKRKGISDDCCCWPFGLFINTIFFRRRRPRRPRRPRRVMVTTPPSSFFFFFFLCVCIWPQRKL